MTAPSKAHPCSLTLRSYQDRWYTSDTPIGFTGGSPLLSFLRTSASTLASGSRLSELPLETGPVPVDPPIASPR